MAPPRAIDKDGRKGECKQIQSLLPAWEGYRWSVEIQGYAFRLRRFIKGQSKGSQYFGLLPWDVWDKLKGYDDDLIRRNLAARVLQRRRELDGDAGERTGTDD